MHCEEITATAHQNCYSSRVEGQVETRPPALSYAVLVRPLVLMGPFARHRVYCISHYRQPEALPLLPAPIVPPPWTLSAVPTGNNTKPLHTPVAWELYCRVLRPYKKKECTLVVSCPDVAYVP